MVFFCFHHGKKMLLVSGKICYTINRLPMKQRLVILLNGQAVHVVAILTALMGVINFFSSSLPASADRLKILEQISPLQVTSGSRLATVLAGFALLLLSVNLWRRKQVAWLLTLVILTISAFGHLLKGLDFEEASIAALLGFGIFILRHQFHARSDFPSIQQGIKVFIFAMGFTLGYGIIGFYLLDRHFSINFGFIPAITQTILMFIEFSNPGLEPITGFGRYFADSVFIRKGLNNRVIYRYESKACVLSTNHSATAETAL